jgi:hypothetical protein
MTVTFVAISFTFKGDLQNHLKHSSRQTAGSALGHMKAKQLLGSLLLMKPYKDYLYLLATGTEAFEARSFLQCFSSRKNSLLWLV